MMIDKSPLGRSELDNRLRAATPPFLMALGALGLLRTSRTLGMTLLGAWAYHWARQADRDRRTRRRDIASRRAIDSAIDQANADSFPASDPPSFSGITAGRSMSENP